MVGVALLQGRRQLFEKSVCELLPPSFFSGELLN